MKPHLLTFSLLFICLGSLILAQADSPSHKAPNPSKEQTNTPRVEEQIDSEQPQNTAQLHQASEEQIIQGHGSNKGLVSWFNKILTKLRQPKTLMSFIYGLIALSILTIGAVVFNIVKAKPKANHIEADKIQNNPQSSIKQDDLHLISQKIQSTGNEGAQQHKT